MEHDYERYATIPIHVIEDHKLPMGARLLFGTIYALTKKMGYCFAYNSKFAEIYGRSNATISNWISCLEERGYINIEVLHGNYNYGVERRIYISDTCKENSPTPENLNRPPQKTKGDPPRKLEGTPPENLKDNKEDIDRDINRDINSDNGIRPDSKIIGINSKKEKEKNISAEKKESGFPERISKYLDEPGTPDFFLECFAEILEWQKSKKLYIDWFSKKGFDKNQISACEIINNLKNATGADGTEIHKEVKKFLNKPDKWWYDNGISLSVLENNFQKIFNSKSNGNTKRDNKPEPSEYRELSDRQRAGERIFI